MLIMRLLCLHQPLRFASDRVPALNPKPDGSRKPAARLAAREGRLDANSRAEDDSRSPDGFQTEQLIRDLFFGRRK